MANCAGCPYLKEDGGQTLCTVRDNEVIDQADYSTETCELYQAYLQTQAPAEGEGEGTPAAEASQEEAAKPGKKQAPAGSTATGCLLSLLIAASLLFVVVLGLIALTVFTGRSTA